MPIIKIADLFYKIEANMKLSEYLMIDRCFSNMSADEFYSIA